MKITPPEKEVIIRDFRLPTKKEILESFSENIRNKVGDIISLWTMSIKWESIVLHIPMSPSPSHRPRLNGYRVYVPGASKNAQFFDKYVRPSLDGLYIHSPCKFNLGIFIETPQSLTQTQKLLAELHVLRPWGSKGDIDNYEKAVYDMIQPNVKRGHIGILSDDSLIIDAHTKKYYSRTPRYELEITYMTNIPDELRKVMKMDGPQFVPWDDIL